MVAFVRRSPAAFSLYGMGMVLTLAGHMVIGYRAFKAVNYDAWTANFLSLWASFTPRQRRLVQSRFQCCGSLSLYTQPELSSPFCAEEVQAPGCYAAYSDFAIPYIRSTYAYAFSFIPIALVAITLTIMVARIISETMRKENLGGGGK
jgi:hypothetical protein